MVVVVVDVDVDDDDDDVGNQYRILFYISADQSSLLRSFSDRFISAAPVVVAGQSPCTAILAMATFR